MKLVFVTNILNHHQAPVADEFYSLIGDKYKFIATSVFGSNKGGIIDYSNRPYLIKSYDSYESMQKSIELINEADVVIIGASSDSYIKQRLKNNKLTFRYSERWLKRWYKFFDYPRKFVAHTLNRNKNLYFLASSAFVANDMRFLFAYKNKCFKWGYFTRVEDLDIDELLHKRSKSNTIKIMWCSRMIDWKHPELVIQLAQRLKNSNYNFQIDMYGDGDKLEPIKKLASQLGVSHLVSFNGAVPNDQITREMQNHHIFLFTSDRFEGWGAVLNEAMSNGCTVVASNKIGAAPYLIEDKFNGRLFDSEDIDSLTDVVESLLTNPSECSIYSRRAYENMRCLWSPKNAAKQFINLAESLLQDRIIEIKTGPCSKAEVIK